MKGFSRSLTAFSLALGTAAMSAAATMVPSAVADSANAHRPASSNIKLGDLASFTVFDIARADFAANRGEIPPEVAEYARSALQNSKLLHYSSPAEGVLRFECKDSGCYRVQATLTYGVDGPVVWQARKGYEQCPFVRYRFQPDSRKVANQLVDKLARDYQKAVKATASRVEIPAE